MRDFFLGCEDWESLCEDCDQLKAFQEEEGVDEGSRDCDASDRRCPALLLVVGVSTWGHGVLADRGCGLPLSSVPPEEECGLTLSSVPADGGCGLPLSSVPAAGGCDRGVSLRLSDVSCEDGSSGCDPAPPVSDHAQSLGSLSSDW